MVVYQIVKKSPNAFMLTNTRYEHILPALTLEELMAHDGDEFIYCAYRTLLGREPDSEGKSYYLRRLDDGISKLQVVAQICDSVEMTAERRGLPGLRRALLQWRRSRWPLVGRWFAPSDVGRHIGGERKLQRIEQSVGALSSEFTVQLNQVSGRLAYTQELIEQIREISHVQSRRLRHVSHVDGVLGRSGERFVLNLSTSHHWRAHPVGIVRVERELAKYLEAYENVTFALWDPATRVLREFDRRHVRSILSDNWCDRDDTSVAQYHHASLPQLELCRGDTFISIGLDWDLSPVHDVVGYLNRYGARFIGGCYDIVPILFPEFSVREGMDQVFRRHFVDMAHAATAVFADSDATRRDLLALWGDAAIEARFPEVSVIPLGATQHGAELPALNDSEADTLRHTLFCGEYVLYVSSLEARKNHRLLVHVWRELHRERGLACPQLIFVGMKGWGVDDLLHQIGRMPAFKDGKIVWLQGVSDVLLAHLYAHSMFTVFPSLYEGWGLAATEALSFGKVCVVADNSALPQAAQGLMPQYHPSDYFAWKAEITRLIDDRAYRAELERKISTDYVSRTWADFSREFCESLLIHA